jgi:hypothetical protein
MSSDNNMSGRQNFKTDANFVLSPVLVNVSSLRIILAFFIASKATVWISERGLLHTFAIYAEAMIVISLGLPLLYFFGKRIRQWTAGRVKKNIDEKKINDFS